MGIINRKNLLERVWVVNFKNMFSLLEAGGLCMVVLFLSLAGNHKYLAKRQLFC